jgi:GR25 family glycosyltransferase involved in LPS biosynthesis
MNSVQIIVITCSSERKAKMQQQFLELNIPYPIKYLDGSTPINSIDFLPNVIDWYKRIICCTRSHIRAILESTKDTSFEYSIILEDDAALHTTDFITTVNNIINIWDTKIISPMVSLGWSPREIYPSHGDLSKTFNLDDIYKYSYRHEMGTIGYIIKNSWIKKYTKLIDHPTYNLFHNSILKHNFNFKRYPYKLDIAYADNLLPLIFSPAVISPPIITEYISKSIVNSANNHDVTRYWKYIYNEKLNSFWSYK